MSATAYKLMSILARDAEAEDAFADQLAAIGADAATTGDHALANGMLYLARMHRTGALKLRGTLAATSAEYGGDFHQHLVKD